MWSPEICCLSIGITKIAVKAISNCMNNITELFFNQILTLPFLLDINECLDGPCHVYGRCTNTLGSYSCSCIEGFYGNGSFCKGKLFTFLL